MQNSIKLKFALVIMFTAILGCQYAVSAPKPGEIGFPSGKVKNSELVNLLLGNTLANESSGDNGLITRYFTKGGETKICVGRGANCGKAEWSVRGGRFCEKHPNINGGDWWCLVAAKYNDKTGGLAATTTGTGTYTYFAVYRGDMLVVEESNAALKKATSANVVTEKVTSENSSAKGKNAARSSSNEDNDIDKLEKKLEYLKARKAILEQIQGLENKLKMFQKELDILQLEFEEGN